MHVQYFEPLSRGWGRMKKALFQPFDISKWFVVGFTAWLAGICDFHGKGGSSNGDGNGHADLEDFVRFPVTAWDWLMDHPGWFALIVAGVCFLFCLGVVLTWLSSRGKFMFVDNVVHDRALISKPWHEYKSAGNSLFVWRLIFGFISFLVIVGFLVLCYFILYGLWESYASKAAIISTIVGLGLIFMTMMIIVGYITEFIDSFIVPIMYKSGKNAIQAWKAFLSLFSKHFIHFIFYGILIFFAYILVVICVIIAGLLTCCIGIVLLIIPYINAVVTLPISYTFRAFSLEFLAQIGKEFDVFPKSLKA